MGEEGHFTGIYLKNLLFNNANSSKTLLGLELM